MKISAFVLLLSMLANLSFASFSNDTLTYQAAFENKDTMSRDGLQVNLLGNWTSIGQAKASGGFSNLSLMASGKFEGNGADGKRVCGHWEVTNDGLSLVLHQICEETGIETSTMTAKIELMDGHMLTLDLPSEQGGKQTFIL